ncbi:hypothetical protein LOZ80_15250 [Paenibacillus sp. HWE-109]|uniref:helix-turn-helix domain-containing protein n=1 Tax=Paenibacillus sp. HWE-109 TaxID=1306526 RepID=UPI001EDD1F8F|nr:hypothetical protein [Paenibacillus sp. HWE-109]UKS30216.1 hypothetical protein LOZ80_15250 [Paenibacillus sp. HWE-109]
MISSSQLNSIEWVSKEKVRLKQIIRDNKRDGLFLLRVQVCLLWLMKFKQTDITEITSLSKVTVNKYISDYKIDTSFKEKKHLKSGRPSFLSKKQTALLIKNLNDISFLATHYNLDMIGAWVMREFNVSYSEKGLQKLLLRLGIDI